VACGLLLLAMSMAGREPLEIDALLAEGLVVAGAWVLGDGVRARRIALLRSEDRAATLELDQEQRAREAVAQERRTIARELHDVVAHNVSVIVAKASAARFVARDAGEVSALSTIERAGRSALTEMRRLTTFLRTDADPVERAPQPSLDDVATLVADARSAGLDVALQTSGTPTAVPESLGLSVYRIVQEALTNVMKHTDDAHVDVIIRFSRGFLAVTIRDDGGRSSTRGRADGAVGFGHVGMRERVALFGGELRVGPRRGTKGYQVTAYLPLDEVER
jgi:signal transduction histidine kinase